MFGTCMYSNFYFAQPVRKAVIISILTEYCNFLDYVSLLDYVSGSHFSIPAHFVRLFSSFGENGDFSIISQTESKVQVESSLVDRGQSKYISVPVVRGWVQAKWVRTIRVPFSHPQTSKNGQNFRYSVSIFRVDFFNFGSGH